MIRTKNNFDSTSRETGISLYQVSIHSFINKEVLQ